MSGGLFNYQIHRINDIATAIDEEIELNDDETIEYGQRRGNGYPPEIIEKFREAAHTLRQAAEMAQCVDKLLSGIDCEDLFLRRWEEEVRDYYEKP